MPVLLFGILDYLATFLLNVQYHCSLDPGFNVSGNLSSIHTIKTNSKV